MNPDWKSRYDLMCEITEQAGRCALEYFDCGVDVQTKADQSPVTIADQKTESMLRESIHRFFPQDGLLGEEFGEQSGTTGYRWIIDPIDGTRSFIRNIPIWGTLVGLEYRSEQIAGAAAIPCWKQLFHALKGNGAFRDQRKINVSTVTDLRQSIITYSSLNFFKAGNCEGKFLQLVEATERSRSYAYFYGFLMVAQGSVDLMLEYGVHIWDVAGLKVIVEEAGGTFSDWQGTPRIDRPDVLASNGKLHFEALKILKG